MLVFQPVLKALQQPDPLIGCSQGVVMGPPDDFQQGGKIRERGEVSFHREGDVGMSSRIRPSCSSRTGSRNASRPRGIWC